MLGVEAIPALIYSVMIFRIPESPRWLIAKRNAQEEARAILQRTDPEGVEAAIRQAIEEEKQEKSTTGFATLFNKKYLASTFLAVLIAFFNQVSGINAIIYFAPRIFEMAGISTESALISTIGIGIVNLLGTFFRALLNRSIRKKDFNVHRFLWLSDFIEPDGIQLPWPWNPHHLVAHLCFRIYSIACNWSRIGDLGLYF